MPDRRSEPERTRATGIDPGIFARQGGHGITSTEIIALVLSILWIAGAGLFFLLRNPGKDGAPGLDALALVITLMAIFLPVAVIWVAAAVARSARIMREEAARLQAAIDAMRHTYLSHLQNAGHTVKPSVEAKLRQIAAAQKQTESAIATFTSQRERLAGTADETRPALGNPEAAPEGDAQPALALGTASGGGIPPLSVEEFIRALNFPEDVDDKEGFAALRRALRDPQVSRLVRAAQDVLTLLSQDGIYMDDLTPDRARPEIWRKFARGERSQAISALGGVHDRSSLALTAGRMRQDPVFRDTAHHFLRMFDQIFAGFETNASDMDIALLADTRTARAFMLLGRVAGTFH